MIAHINTQDLIQAMPEMKAAQSEIDRLAESYESEVQNTLKELNDKLKRYNEEAESQPPETTAERMKEVEEMRENILKFQAQAQKELQKKEVDLLQPITAKAMAAIKLVAIAKGFDYVLDAGGVIVANGPDLMADVKAQLGI